jgi:DHA1 family tetracycline resistance protein-like MFS transporter
VVILFFIVFIGMVGFGIILPIFPFYAERVGASPTIITWTMSAFTVGQAISAPIWGRLSDAYGRRLVLILTMFGSALSYVMLAYADDLWLVITSRVFGGLMAGNIAAAFAYVTDITTEENRPAGLGKVGAAMGLGFIFGPALGGLLAGPEVETANFLRPALTAAAVSLITMVGTIIFLPESLPKADRKPLFGARNGSPQVSLAAVNRSGLLKLIVAVLVFYVGMSQMESIFPIWAKDMFSMGPRDIGGVFFVIGLIVVIMQGGLIGPLSRRFGEQPVAIAAGVFFAIGLACMGLATTSWMLWVSLVPFAIGVGLFNPTVSSMVSKTVSANERGAIMGRYQSASALGRVIGPLLCGPLYTFVGMSAPFILGAAIMLPVLWLLSRFVLHPDPSAPATVAESE